MLTGLWRALASAGNKSAISGKGWPGDVHGRIVWQGLVQGYSGGIDNGVSEGPVMVVHPRSKSESSLAEALRLVKTYTGEKEHLNGNEVDKKRCCSLVFQCAVSFLGANKPRNRRFCCRKLVVGKS